MITALGGKEIKKGFTVLSGAFPSTSLKQHRNKYKRVFAGEVFSETEFIASPGRFWSDISYSPIYKNKEIVGAACHARDITSVKLAEQNLLESQSRLIEAQSLSHTGNYEFDIVNGTYVWSAEIFNIFGINKAEVAPSMELFLSFVHPGDVKYLSSRMQESLDKFSNSSTEFKFIRNDGQLRYGSAEVKVEAANNKMTRYYGIMADITERKLADLQHAKLMDDLITRNKDLEQFAYIISHNLRGPVSNIIGASDTLKDDDLSLEDIETLNSGIQTSVLKLDSVITDLNYILQVKGETNKVKELVSLPELLQDIENSIADLITSTQVNIQSDFTQADRIFALKPYLYSIFYNLISNSIKYRQQDIKTAIEITSRKIDNNIVLTFEDNGMGIDLTRKGDQVFGLYKRFHTNIEGKGMGLFMVKTQVESLGGKIQIESAPNEGDAIYNYASRKLVGCGS